MREVSSLYHTRWECKYHIVFIPKYRRKVLFGQIRKEMGEVFHRLARQKENLIEEGHLMPDHVLCRALHNRKNWLFSASIKGVNASANLYSLIETAKANGLEPYAYLRHLFAELPKAETVAAIEALLPGNLRKDQIRIG